ncbi:MAG: division/cell wall cluster transcriptional repressor MraZ [Patescibacteria group bacterium]
MLIGEYQHSIDGKGRVAIPAKFRRDLEGGVVVTKGLDNCLFVYPKDVWVKQAEKMSGLSANQANSRAYGRFILGGATDSEFDGQGRILISDYLRSYAGIKEKVVIVGLYNRVEIWDEAKWHEYKSHMEKNAEKIAEDLGQMS